MPAIFISYRREDSIAYSGRLYDRLTAEFGKNQVFMDIDSIDPGADFIDVIEKTVASCDAVLVVIGKQWLSVADAQGRRRIENPEDFVRLEVWTALSRKVRVVPVLVGGAQMPRSDELPEALVGLTRRHALDLPDTAFHQTLGRLIDSLRRDEPQSREQAQPGRPKPEALKTGAPIWWAVAALVAVALAVGGAVVYFRTPSRPATMRASPNATSGMAQTTAGSDEASSDKPAPKMSTTTTAAAPMKKGVPRPDTGANAREPVAAPAVSPRIAEPPALRAGQAKVNPKDGLTYVWIPPGTFTMGCSVGSSDCLDSEKPTHPVTITTGFWIGQTPVTQEAYQRVEGKDPSRFKGSQLPVETVNWDEAQSYCRAVGMRLPTETEWEYAARAGTAGSRYGDIDQVAWYSANSGSKTHDVMQKQPNAWGLYDMLGNVRQWTADWFSDKYSGNSETDPHGPASGEHRVVRGAGWGADAPVVRASVRYGVVPANRSDRFGFRCAGEVR